jgi:CRISPR/Cas system endoribonuclease Cas6 (RAMP superfamily)
VKTSKDSQKRRNISWKSSTDELAEKLANEKKMNVSALLERLVLDECEHQRIEPKSGSSFFQMLSDIIDAKLDERHEQLNQAKAKNLGAKGKN